MSSPGPGSVGGIVMYGTAWCGDCALAMRIFAQRAVDLDRIDVHGHGVDIDQHPEVVPLVLKINRGMRSVPTIVFPDGSTLTEPSASQLEQKLLSLR